MLECLTLRRTDLLHVYHSSYQGELLQLLGQFGSGLVRRGIDRCALDLNLPVPEQDKAFMLSLYMNAFMGVIRRWLEDGMVLTPAYISSRCEAVMHRSIRGSLSRLNRGQTVDNSALM